MTNWTILSRSLGCMFLIALTCMAQNESHVLVEAGQARHVTAQRAPWSFEGGALVAQGSGRLLRSDYLKASGDSQTTIRLSIDALEHTAAALQLPGGRLLFDARGGRLATKGVASQPCRTARYREATPFVGPGVLRNSGQLRLPPSPVQPPRAKSG